jgi:hypothetical protein
MQNGGSLGSKTGFLQSHPSLPSWCLQLSLHIVVSVLPTAGFFTNPGSVASQGSGTAKDLSVEE